MINLLSWLPLNLRTTGSGGAGGSGLVLPKIARVAVVLPETEVVDDFAANEPVVVVLRGQWCRPIWWAAQKRSEAT